MMAAKSIKAVLIIITLCILTSCSLLMPYQDQPLCSKGRVGGYCGPLNEVYDVTTQDIDTKNKQQKKGGYTNGTENCPTCK
jgi:hypothetical protein